MPQGPAITIGNFDGVHCGHQALVRACRAQAGPAGRVLALAFEPHPLSVLRPEAAPARLGAFPQRCRWLTHAGADEVIRLDPTPDFLSLSPEIFVQRLCEQWRPRAIIEGPDFRFGRNRAGSIHDLRRLGELFDFHVITIEPVEAVLIDHVTLSVSSTMIRWLLARGRAADAAIMLGRDYEIESIVERGRQRGRELGFPTVNLADNGCLVPADGVYAGEAELPDGTTRLAAISVGKNPTFVEARRTCEAYLLKFDGWTEEYGWPIRLRFNSWMRDQIVFGSVDALKSQIARDIDRIRGMLSPITSKGSS